MGCLLLVELLLLLGSFTATDLESASEPWLRLMARAGMLPQILLAIATALLLFGPQRQFIGARAPPAPPRPAARVVVLLLAQLGSYALLYRLSDRIFEERLVGAGRPEPWLLAWASTAVATAALAALLCRPLPDLLAWSRRSAAFLLGACLVGIVAWLAGAYVADDLRTPLRGPTLWLAERCVGLFVPETVVDSEEFIFGTQAFRVRVAPQCSGFEGIGLTCVFTLAYLCVFRRNLRFPQALLLPVIGVLAVWLINVLRLAGLVLLGSSGHERLAAGGFHSVAGTLAFCAVALALVALSRRMRFFWRSAIAPDEDTEYAQADATAAYLVPFLLAVAAGMVVQAFADSAPVLEALRTLVVGAALLYFWRDYDLRLGRNLAGAIVLGLVAAVIWIALPQPGGEGATPELGELRSGGWSGITLLLRLIGYIVVFPLAEELAFRAYLMRRLTSASWQQVSPASISPMAWIVSTLIFGLLHEHWIAATLSGAIYGIAFVRRGSLASAVVAHGLTNAALVTCVLLGFPDRPLI